MDRASSKALIAAVLALATLFASQSLAQKVDMREEMSTAIMHDNVDSVRAYLEEENIGVDQRSEYGELPLAEAINLDSPKVAMFLIQRGANINLVGSAEFKTPLFHDACAAGNVEIIELMLKKGVNFKSLDKYGQNALEVAAMNGQRAAYQRLLKAGLTTKAKAHVAAGLGNLVELTSHIKDNVDIRTGWQETPLHYACNGAQLEACKLLLKNGADIDAKNVIGMTSMHFAVLNEDIEKAKKVVQLLLAKGASINAKDNEGMTPLDYSGDIYDYLEAKGAVSGE